MNTVVRVTAKDNTYRPDVISQTSSVFTPTLVSTPRGNALSRTTYGVAGQIFNTHTLDSSILFTCVITPVDSNGVKGEPIVTEWNFSNF